MYTGQVAVISNQADWQLDGAYELVDETDDTTTDLTDPALTVDIVVTIADVDGCTRATASLENGKVTIPGPGFTWRFERADFGSRLCAGTYKCGAKVTIDGYVNDLIIGTIAVLEGNR